MFFFFNDTATTEIYTLSLHDALPISRTRGRAAPARRWPGCGRCGGDSRSEEHTSELQSRFDLVCRLLLEKKKKTVTKQYILQVLTNHTRSTSDYNPDLLFIQKTLCVV